MACRSSRNGCRPSSKIELIDRLSATGVAKIEATSFVSPKAVPNLRDAEAVMLGITRNPAVTYVALVPNARGAERALARRRRRDRDSSSRCRKRTIAPTCGAASPSRSPDFAKCSTSSRGSRRSVVGALATSFGCPFEGVIPERQVIDGVARYVDLGVAGVTLADTTGMANPRQVEALVRRVRERWPDLELALHFHNTRGMGLANVLAGLARRRRALRRLLSADSAAVRSRPARPATSAPRTWCTCCTAWAIDTGVDLDRLLADIAAPWRDRRTRLAGTGGESRQESPTCIRAAARIERLDQAAR